MSDNFYFCRTAKANGISILKFKMRHQCFDARSSFDQFKKCCASVRNNFESELKKKKKKYAANNTRERRKKMEKISFPVSKREFSNDRQRSMWLRLKFSRKSNWPFDFYLYFHWMNKKKNNPSAAHTMCCERFASDSELCSVFNWFKLPWVIWEWEWKMKMGGWMQQRNGNFMKCEYSENNHGRSTAHSIWYGKYTLCAFKTFNYVFLYVRSWSRALFVHAFFSSSFSRLHA